MQTLSYVIYGGIVAREHCSSVLHVNDFIHTVCHVVTSGFIIAGIANGGGSCELKRCGSITTIEKLSSSPIESVDHCKSACYNNSFCQMITYQEFPLQKQCSLYESQQCTSNGPGSDSALSLYNCYKIGKY